MAPLIVNDGVTSTVARYVEVKVDGSFQYRRRIPLVLREVYPGKVYFVKSLGRNKIDIIKKCYIISRQIEEEWQLSGWRNPRLILELPRQFSLKEAEEQRTHVSKVQCLNLSEACDLYLSMHPSGNAAKFRSDTLREVTRVIGLCGNLSINAYTRDHAEIFRNDLLRNSKTSTVRRRLSVIVALFNRVIHEKQLAFLNVFENLGSRDEGIDETKRIPFDTKELGIVSSACRNLDDDI